MRDQRSAIYIGDHVEKIGTDRFTGEVRSCFTNLKGEARIVVECIVGDAIGVMNIFPLEAVRVLAGPEYMESLKRLHGLL